MLNEPVKVYDRMCVGTIEACVVPDDNVSVDADPVCCDAITSAHLA